MDGRHFVRGPRGRPARTAGAGLPHGHAHFWDRFSRRRFLQTGAAASLFLLGGGRWNNAVATPHGVTPRPIPGGFVFGPPVGDEVFHNFAPNVFDPLDTDPSA